MNTKLTDLQRSGGSFRASLLVGLAAIVAPVVIGCASDAEPPAQPTTQPTSIAEPTPTATTVSAPTAAPTTAATVRPTAAAAQPTVESSGTPMSAAAAAEAARAAKPPAPEVQGCGPGLSIGEQKEVLVTMAKQLFAGTTLYNSEVPRLHYEPEARDDRQGGGIWLVVEFNGDDRGEVVEKKASLDVWMRDAYDAFYNSGCDRLTRVDLSGYGEALGRPPIGPTVVSNAIVFKTSMKRDVAEGVDWANKDSLDFDEIWQTMIMVVRWKRELEGLRE